VDDFNLEEVVKVLLVIFATLLVASCLSCSSLTPSLPQVPSFSSTDSAPPASKVTAISKDIESSLWNYSWLAIVLSFCFPSLRQPLVFFLKSIFGFLALPFHLAERHLMMLYNNKYKNGKEG
tara:strand:+ start:1247 stop:1612 length:366 start_codon:yes stop_codon:yes gene_type:complete